ncbi:hypothetical protein Pcinc_016210 [Petrolisthes cinctipes]|uniref:Uncharacterized protein n=1 Tax=Petrolisthes cinctipes TaxID=88211 RepID=A0AAE1KM72_PETCI|nr:hypothetical protein Pcinc_016210 [Petrolisthes cinctipes]
MGGSKRVYIYPREGEILRSVHVQTKVGQDGFSQSCDVRVGGGCVGSGGCHQRLTRWLQEGTVGSSEDPGVPRSQQRRGVPRVRTLGLLLHPARGLQEGLPSLKLDPRWSLVFTL